MITVQIYKKNSLINIVNVAGHANYAESGKDIVCAGVSAICVGAANALNELIGHANVHEDDGYLNIKFEDDHDSQLIAETMILQLKTIEESYKSYLKIIYC